MIQLLMNLLLIYLITAKLVHSSAAKAKPYSFIFWFLIAVCVTFGLAQVYS